ncbi:flavin reductase family protein [Nocardiopsis tropica]|uniref:3-hydroxy-9,10-secoandrosta-1,3,5(10)-triene-9, 17-dione monooxygenase reductase subunit n=1 Tax=Tsukamurella strandjordii TaxID=147577 RepID=UPI0031D38E54
MTEQTSPVKIDPIEPLAYRTAMGHFCTGVTVITAADEEGPVGFACQSFSALSLDPPLVLFCPMKTSGAWRTIERTGRFAVNVLSENQQAVSSVFGSRHPDKFGEVRWRPSPTGSPLLDDALSWIDCTVETVHDGGDHHIVIGRVQQLSPPNPGRPLLFYRGRYTQTVTDPGQAIPRALSLDAFLTWPVGDDWM